MDQAFDMKKITIGIDATNIRQGGGVTHLAQMLMHTELDGLFIERVIVWSGKETGSKLPVFPWLEKVCPNWADASFPLRILGQQFALPSLVKAAGCDVLFSPGGTLPARCPVATVTMSQNMLPFEPLEAERFGRWSAMWLKLQLLRQSQSRSFRRADGLIFLTEYARNTVLCAIGGIKRNTTTIPHGIEERFEAYPRPQRNIENCSTEHPFRLLYVSIMMPYKHQIEVASAVKSLREDGIPVSIQFIGPDWGSYGTEFAYAVERMDAKGEYLQWSGALSFNELHEAYQGADAFVFASSCENLPNILIEAMSAGLPIACSSSGPMPEVLNDAGLYFDPVDSNSIYEALRKLIFSPELRENISQRAWKKSRSYSWNRCAAETFGFIAEVAQKKHQQLNQSSF